MKAPNHFELGKFLPVEESRLIEFKEIKGANPVGSIVNASDEYAVSFLNSEGGQVFWGVRNDGTVVGVELTAAERDEICRGINGKLHDIQPGIDPSAFHINAYPVIGAESRFVVVLTIPNTPSAEPYSTGKHEVWVRTDGVKKKLTIPQLVAWMRTRANRNESSPLNPEMAALLKRVRRVFTAHGIEPMHMARFFKQMEAPFTIGLTDLETNAAFLRWIDEAKLDWIANMFAIRREWLDGEDEQIHVNQYWDKHTEQFVRDVDDLCAVMPSDTQPDLPLAYYLQGGVGREWEKNDYLIYIVLKVPLIRISERRIVYKYLVDFDAFPWKYPRCNIQLRAWARFLEVNRHFTVHGKEVPKMNIEKLTSNRFFLHELLDDHKFMPHAFWHPADHAVYPEESVCAKSVDTLPHVIEFLKKNSLPWEPSRPPWPGLS